MSESRHNRRNPRAKVQLPVSFAVVVPEDTFAPQVCDAVVCDISVGGLMVAAKLKEEVYRDLLHAMRYVRVTFADGVPLPRRLIGRAVYIQPITHGEGREYRVGVSVDEISPADRAQLQAYMDSLPGVEQSDRPPGES